MDRYVVRKEEQFFMGLPSVAGPKYVVAASGSSGTLFEGDEAFCKHMAFLLNFAADWVDGEKGVSR